eukprot:Clim_evm62s134 gene=Clim_evmTU62s134
MACVGDRIQNPATGVCDDPDCDIAYLGERNFFNTASGRCEEVPSCTSEEVYDGDTNTCRSLSDLFGPGDGIDPTDLLPPDPDIITGAPIPGSGSSPTDINCNNGKLDESGTYCVCDEGWATKSNQNPFENYEWCNSREIEETDETYNRDSFAFVTELLFGSTTSIAIIVGIIVICIWRRRRRHRQNSSNDTSTTTSRIAKAIQRVRGNARQQSSEREEHAGTKSNSCRANGKQPVASGYKSKFPSEDQENRPVDRNENTTETEERPPQYHESKEHQKVEDKIEMPVEALRTIVNAVLRRPSGGQVSTNEGCVKHATGSDTNDKGNAKTRVFSNNATLHAFGGVRSNTATSAAGAKRWVPPKHFVQWQPPAHFQRVNLSQLPSSSVASPVPALMKDNSLYGMAEDVYEALPLRRGEALLRMSQEHVGPAQTTSSSSSSSSVTRSEIPGCVIHHENVSVLNTRAYELPGQHIERIGELSSQTACKRHSSHLQQLPDGSDSASLANLDLRTAANASPRSSAANRPLPSQPRW